MSRQRLPLAAALAAAAFAALPAVAAERCYDFRHQAPETGYPVPGSIAIGIGEVKVRPLMAGGVEVAPNNRMFVAKDQRIAGGSAPEMYAKNVAVQMLPDKPVQQVTLRFSHQPGANDGRAAFVEVNGERHEFSGSFGALNGRKIGGAHPARLTVELGAPNANHVPGRLRVEGKDGIRSLSIGAGELRLDDVCFGH